MSQLTQVIKSMKIIILIWKMERNRCRFLFIYFLVGVLISHKKSHFKFILYCVLNTFNEARS